MPETIEITLITSEGVSRVREGAPAPANLFPDEPPEEKRIYSRVSAEDLERAMRALRAVGGAKVVWELLHAIWRILAEE
ncbi:MAG: hypothetical protein F4Z32_04935 [Gemmatimonadetes bacterium]|nr:hypothetical protein [Gemmatimonadota bacterium]